MRLNSYWTKLVKSMLIYFNKQSLMWATFDESDFPKIKITLNGVPENEDDFTNFLTNGMVIMENISMVKIMFLFLIQIMLVW